MLPSPAGTSTTSIAKPPVSSRTDPTVATRAVRIVENAPGARRRGHQSPYEPADASITMKVGFTLYLSNASGSTARNAAIGFVSVT